jgi:glyoxylase I family protein
MKPFIHHVLVVVQELERSRRFYRDTLELEEIDRPVFPYDGAWFQLANNQQLHLLERSDATFRGERGVDAFDLHFAMRVKSYRDTLGWLRTKGFHEDAPEGNLRRMILNPKSVTGFPQIYILDPDRNIVEYNCETLE